MKKLGLLLLIVVSLILSGCASESSTVAQQQQQYTENQPIPKFDFSLERDVLIQLYGMRNDALTTYTVVVSSFGNLLWECPSIGYPLSAETQLTNPEAYYANGAVLPQPEPNGLYQGGSFGTWVMCVLPDGTVYPVYTEMNANTFPFPVKYDQETGVFTKADDTVPIKSIKISK